jgi:hypothetical protein
MIHLVKWKSDRGVPPRSTRRVFILISLAVLGSGRTTQERGYSSRSAPYNCDFGDTKSRMAVNTDHPALCWEGFTSY